MFAATHPAKHLLVRADAEKADEQAVAFSILSYLQSFP
jgi:hypothetical protein